MKKIIRLTESDLHRIVKKSVNKIIKEWGEYVPDPSDFLDQDPYYQNYFDEDGVEYDFEGNPIEDDEFDDERYYNEKYGDPNDNGL
jgi:hypothetical protein